MAPEYNSPLASKKFSEKERSLALAPKGEESRKQRGVQRERKWRVDVILIYLASKKSPKLKRKKIKTRISDTKIQTKRYLFRQKFLTRKMHGKESRK